jgi:hypothetical protein
VLHSSRAFVFVCLLFITACAVGGRKMSSARMAAEPAAAAAMPAPLDRSVFDKNPHGQLTEDAIQKILASPIELSLPSRVGVLPIATARDWRGPSPDDRVPAGVPNFVDTLRRDAAFSLVTQTMVIPSGALGMEALREVAARYRLRYLLLYREVLAKKTRLNPWAAGYATVVGAFFLPGQKHEVFGYIEASMFDVKTGLLMFTTRRAITAQQNANVWYGDVKLDRLASNATSKFSVDLAADVLTDLRRFAAAAVAENAHRGAAPMVQMPGVDGPSVATDSH